MKVTQWFSASVKPVRVGTYQVKFDDSASDKDAIRRYWDGSRWRLTKHGVTSSFGLPPADGEVWRGLAEEPKAKK